MEKINPEDIPLNILEYWEKLYFKLLILLTTSLISNAVLLGMLIAEKYK